MGLVGTLTLGLQLADLARTAASHLSPSAPQGLGAPVEGTDPSALPAGPAARPSPGDPLEHLELTSATRLPLTPPAQTLGLAFRDVPLRMEFSGREHRVTELYNHAASRTLVQLPAGLLKDTSAAARRDLFTLRFLFPDSRTVFVFAEGVDVPELPHRNIMSNLWKQGEPQIQGIFVPWQDIRALATKPPAEQIEFVRDQFDWKSLSTSGLKALTVADLNDIVGVILDFADFSDTRGRKAVLMQAGLRDVADGVDLQGAASTVAFMLVVHLLDQPPIPGRSTAIGALIDALVSTPGVPPDRVALLTAVKGRHGL
jgi:Effector-associated domain 8